MDYTPLINFLKEKMSIRIEEEKYIQRYFKPKFFRKKAILEHPDSTHCKFYFVNSGLVRAFYNNEKGRECTRIIAWENRFLANIPVGKNFSFSTETIECLEDSALLVIEKSDFHHLLLISSMFKNIYFSLLEEYNFFYLKRFQVLSSFDIKYKMEYIKIDYPHLIGRVSDSVLASYLCITRETFVRYKHLLY